MITPLVVWGWFLVICCVVNRLFTCCRCLDALLLLGLYTTLCLCDRLRWVNLIPPLVGGASGLKLAYIYTMCMKTTLLFTGPCLAINYLLAGITFTHIWNGGSHCADLGKPLLWLTLASLVFKEHSLTSCMWSIVATGPAYQSSEAMWQSY